MLIYCKTMSNTVAVDLYSNTVYCGNDLLKLCYCISECNLPIFILN
jgi:hypothetical protein